VSNNAGKDEETSCDPGLAVTRRPLPEAAMYLRLNGVLPPTAKK
jgi:hypothetical protein